MTRTELAEKVDGAISDFQYLIDQCSSGNERDRLCQEFEKLALLVDELIFLVKDGDK